MKRRTIDEWRREVFRSTVLSDRTKVLLLFLAENMREDRKVSLPRDQIARALGKSERRITERITEAHDAGWLSTVVRGQKGVTAVYQGLFPDVVSGTDARPLNRKPSKFSGTPTSPLNDAETRPLNEPNHAFRGRTSVPPIEERTSSRVVTGRDVGSEEKAEGTLVRFPATGCVWHEHFCPDDCAKQPESRKAS